MPGSAASPALLPPVRPASAPLLRRLSSMLYESLIITALLMFSALLFLLPLEYLTGHDASAGPSLWAFRIYLVAVVGAYFGWFWINGGQTLPMRTWRVRLLSHDDQPVDRATALRRYLLCWPSVLAGGAGIVWALFDRDRQFLHDRLAGTRLVRVDR